MGINLKFPLRAYRRGFFEMNETTTAAVRENIKTLLMTVKGERVVNPSVGTNIPTLMGQLFEQIEPGEMEARIGAEITTALATWMPEVQMVGITVYTQDTLPGGTALNPNDILVRMDYTYSGVADMVDLNFTTD
jgi:phage baseplate assembly protein W|tara:strand:+ start:148 stop:549 length:402 start_codon:yes stop_codon:yes gene_type:complete